MPGARDPRSRSPSKSVSGKRVRWSSTRGGESGLQGETWFQTGHPRARQTKVKTFGKGENKKLLFYRRLQKQTLKHRSTRSTIVIESRKTSVNNLKCESWGSSKVKKTEGGFKNRELSPENLSMRETVYEGFVNSIWTNQSELVRIENESEVPNLPEIKRRNIGRTTLKDIKSKKCFSKTQDSFSGSTQYISMTIYSHSIQKT